MPTQFAILAWAGFALGLIVWRLGRRGRRIDDHPWCRRCRFDLFGSPKAAETCPECGAGLKKRGAVRHGHRQPIRAMWVMGLVMTLVGGAGAGIWSYDRLGEVEWVRYKPLGWLVADVDSKDRNSAGVATYEILRRLLEAKSLSLDSQQGLLDMILAFQADRARPWNPAWGRVIDIFRRSGHMDDARWERFVDQAVTLGLKVRSPIGREDPWVSEMEHSDFRYDFEGGVRLLLDSTEGVVELVPVSQTSGGKVLWENMLYETRVEYPEVNQSLRVPPGKYLLRMDAVALFDPHGSFAPETLIRAKAQRIEAAIEVLDAPTSVRVIDDAEVLERITKLAAGEVRATRGAGIIVVELDTALTERMHHHRLEVSVDGRVTASRERIDRLTRLEIQDPLVGGGGAASAKLVDLVFTPDVEAASRTFDVFEILGRVEVRGVKVEDGP